MTRSGAEGITVGLVGAGRVAEVHLEATSMLDSIHVAAIHDIDSERLHRVADEWGVKAEPSMEGLMEDEEIEAVLILTPASSHVEIAIRFLESGKHVLVEKPVAEDSLQIARLLEVAATSDRVVMPGHNYAYIPEFKRIRRIVRNGHLGVIRALWITYAIAHPEEVARAYGGVLTELMVHHSYLTLALLGKPDVVHAGVTEPAWVAHAAEDQAWMTWVYDSKVTAHLFASFAVGDQGMDPWSFVVKVLGTKGSASFSFRSAIFARGLGTLDVALPIYEESFGEELRAFADAITLGSELTSTLEDALTVARLIEQARTASIEGSALEQVDASGNPRW